MEINKRMSVGKIIAISLGILVLLLLFWGVGSYNSLVGLRENVDNQSSNVDVNLKRRADLISNLVNTVKGYASHETEIIESISKSRAQLAGASNMSDKAQADSQLTSALNRLMVVVENYPDLKANANFTYLMDELSGTESRISVARKDYNDAVRTYNQKTRTFPTVVIANMMGFSQKDYFEAPENSKEVPNVDFS